MSGIRICTFLIEYLLDVPDNASVLKHVSVTEIAGLFFTQDLYRLDWIRQNDS